MVPSPPVKAPEVPSCTCCSLTSAKSEAVAAVIPRVVSDATVSEVSATTAPVLVILPNEEAPATIPTIVKLKSPVDAPVKVLSNKPK